MTDQPSAESIFFGVMERPDLNERKAYLDKVCGHDTQLRKRIEQMIAAAPDMGSFLEKPLGALEVTGEYSSGSESGVVGSAVSMENEGSNIGPYKLVQLLGEGGMGTVWMAEQEKPVKRRVALKIVKAGMDSARVIARFEAERQALALMDHTNIAKVFDAGRTDTGRPYFVMELVRGVPITLYCDQLQLTIQERLALFIQVCAAVQHAHQKGIIHRDLKPSNVLVAVQDGKPVPKVIDFGVAKAIHTKLGENTLDTEIGAVIGTLEYMAPEQAELSALDIDTRADLYALGVLLYELLTGTTPMNRSRLKKAAFSEMLRIIKEVEPAKPSTCLSQSKETMGSLAAQRRTEPHRLARMVSGDLDWIVLKTLEKDRTRRYESVNGLARDIERYLANEPVEACPPSQTYRLGKFIKRNRGSVIAGTVVAMAIFVGLVGTSIGFVQANRARDAEADQRRIAVKERDEKEKARENAESGRIEAENRKKEAEEQRTIAALARENAEKTLYFNRINLAQQYWLANNLAQSQKGLNDCPVNTREWEWHYLDRLNHPELFALPGNGQFPIGLQFNQVGNRLASFASSGDSGVRIWDLLTKKPISEINLNSTGKQFSSFCFNHDGKTILLGEMNGTIGIWDVDTGKFVREFQKTGRAANSLSQSPDGKKIAAAFANGRNGEALVPLTESPRNEDLIVWDADTGKEIFHPKGFGMAAAFSPDGSKLLAFRKNTGVRLTPGTPEFFVTLFDASNWKEIQPDSWGAAQCYSFSGDGKKLVLGGNDRIKNQSFIKVFDLGSNKTEPMYLPLTRDIRDLEVNQDGSLLAYTHEFGSTDIAVCQLDKKKETTYLKSHTQTINSIRFSPDGRLFSCSWENTIKCWDPKQSPEFSRLAASSGVFAEPARLSPGGKFLAFGQSQSVSLLFGAVALITIIEAETGQKLKNLGGHSNGTKSLSFNHKGDRLISGSRYGEAKVWDFAQGKLLGTFQGPKGEIAAIALSPDGKWGASTHEPPEVTQARFGNGVFKNIPVDIKVWEAATGKEKWSLAGHPSGVYNLTFSPSGRLLASSGYNTIKIWNLESGMLVKDLDVSKMKSSTEFMAFGSSDEKFITAGKGHLEFWDIATGQPDRSIAIGSVDSKKSYALDDQQKRLAIGSDQKVKIWDLATGQEILTLTLQSSKDPSAEPNRISTLAWTTNGERLRAGLANGSIIEWNGSPRDPLFKSQ